MSSEIAKNGNREIAVRFKPRARLLLQLGDQLIKNESIALIELVKNSYDADTNVVNIYMENVENSEEGIIIIEDDGIGMSLDIVENVWLEPGSDFKQKQLSERINPENNYEGRLPIGEKGIGRFGAHKLGNIIEMTTKSANTKEVFIKIDWTKFDEYKYLEEVPIIITERQEPRLFKNDNTGTNIQITKLRKTWTRGMAREIKRSITALASPFNNNDAFKTSFEVLDKPKWFDGLVTWESIKEYSLFKFKVVLEADEILYFDYQFIPWTTMTKLFPRNVNLDNPLIDNFKKLQYPKEYDNEGMILNLSNHKIGKVTFEGYVFDREAFVLKMGVSDKKGFKNYLNANGGVRVFRDGLRVYDYGEPETDWLGLDLRRVQQPSKRISNNIILGALSLSRRYSNDLVEKTNREGFVQNEAYEAFRASILYVIDLIETLRVPDKKKLKELYGPTPKSSPVMSTLSEAKKFVEEKVKESKTQKQIIRYFTKVESDYKNISENLLKAAGAGLSMSVVVHEVEKIVYEILKVLRAEKASERVLKLVQHLSSLIDGYAEIIRKSSQTSENVTQVIEQALFNTEYRLNAHKIEVIKAYKDYRGIKRLKFARNLLIGSIMNLIDNAIYWLDRRDYKAREDKESYQKKIFINLIEEDNYINLLITDNGTGFLIPTDDITEPFVSAKPGGMGLGLHIVSEIMEAQSGRLIFPEEGDFEIPNEFEEGASIVLAFKK